MDDLIALTSRRRELAVKRYYHNQAYVENYRHNQWLMKEMARLDDEILVIDLEIATNWKHSMEERAKALSAIRKGLAT